MSIICAVVNGGNVGSAGFHGATKAVLLACFSAGNGCPYKVLRERKDGAGIIVAALWAGSHDGASSCCAALKILENATLSALMMACVMLS